MLALALGEGPKGPGAQHLNEILIEIQKISTISLGGGDKGPGAQKSISNLKINVIEIQTESPGERAEGPGANNIIQF